MAYTQVTISGYNAGPPTDDGSTSPANMLAWSTIKVKLFDPLNSALETINTNITSAIATEDASLASLQASISTTSDNVDALSGVLKAPSGTVMLFKQAAAPTGWTKGTTFDDYALRLVTDTTGGQTGGSASFTSVFTNRSIQVANLPAHTHTFSDASSNLSFSGDTNLVASITVNRSARGILGGTQDNYLSNAGANSVEVTGSFSFSDRLTNSSGSSSTIDFAVQYVDVIYATKT